ncbi:MAG: 8-oxoguanine deaminase [Actinomycetia bacterium]|nr:8-oxoguanine deaminase [Actinomycetes bacterium]
MPSREPTGSCDERNAVTDSVDLLIQHADLLATVDTDGREIAGGWVAITDGLVSGVGAAGSEPRADRTIDASGCLVTPGLINTHHHLYQNLTRAYGPALDGNLFHWLRTLYPKWARLDEEAAFVSAWVGLAELAESGCTTSTDHLYVHPRGGGDLLSAEIAAAVELGVRFHPTRGSMSLSEKDGGLPPDSVVQDDDTILAQSEEAVRRHHDRSHGAMVRVALAPCSPFSVTADLMKRTAELAERLDVRLHTHLAEDVDEDDFCMEMFGARPIDHFEAVGWASDRSWIAHCVQPDDDEIERLGGWRVGVAHCPSSNMILGSGVAPVRKLRAAGVPVGLGCDGSASADSGSLWTEARNAMLSGRLKGFLDGTRSLMSSRDVLEMATRGGAACLGREGELGELSVGAVGDVVLWSLDGLSFAGALSDPIEAWLRCGPTSARTTIVGGTVVVDNGSLVADNTEERLAQHRRIAEAMQR